MPSINVIPITLILIITQEKSSLLSQVAYTVGEYNHIRENKNRLSYGITYSFAVEIMFFRGRYLESQRGNEQPCTIIMNFESLS